MTSANLEDISYLHILGIRQIRCEFTEMRDAGFPCRVFSADDSKVDGFVFAMLPTLSFVVMIETFVDEPATAVAKLIQSTCAAGVFGYHLQHEIFREKARRGGLAQIVL